MPRHLAGSTIATRSISTGSAKSGWAIGRAAALRSLGDAAFCISLIGGQGSAIAITAAFVLAGELARSRGDYAEAFRRYEQLLQPYLALKQKATERFASAFVPKTPFGLWFRKWR